MITEPEELSNEKLIKILFHNNLIESKAEGRTMTRKEMVNLFCANKKKGRR